jgi:hypothetical protein
MKVKLVLFVAIIAGLVALSAISFRQTQLNVQREAKIVNPLYEDEVGNNPKTKSPSPIIPGIKSFLSLKAYPNPADGNVDVAVNVEDMRDITLRVMDLTGKIITTKVVGYLVRGDNIINIETSGIKSGIYVLTGTATGTKGDVYVGKIKLVIRH